MAFTKINAAGIGTTETVTVDGLTVINDGSFGGNLTVSGVLTYEDVTNVDSVGLITARNGIVVGSGITLSKDGDIFATGITTVSGNVKVGTGITLSPDGDGFYTGVTTATTFSGAFSGSGANITALNASNLASGTVPTARLGSGTASSSTFLRGDSTFAAVTSTTINSNTNNYLITGTGTADTLQGESDLQFDGAHLTQAILADGEGFNQTASGNHYIDNVWNANRTIAGSAIGRITGQWNGTEVASIKYIAGSDTTNKDDAHITFHTSSANNNTERLRITSGGNIGIGDRTTSPDELLHVHTASGEAKIHVEAATNARVRIRAHSGESIVQFADAASSNPGEINYTHSSDSMSFRTNGSVRSIIDSSGRLLVGTTSARAAFQFTTSAGIQAEGAYNHSSISSTNNENNGNSSAFVSAKIRGTGACGADDLAGSHDFQAYDGTAFRTIARMDGIVRNSGSGISNNVISGDIRFVTRIDGQSMHEMLRLDHARRALFGTTALPSGSVGGSSIDCDPSDYPVYWKSSSAQYGASAYTHFQFFNTNGSVGQILIDGSGTSFVTSSDYRLKENQTAITDGITRLKQLKPYKFNFKADSSTVLDGFFAHEVSSVVPEAVSGEKDAVATEANVKSGIAENVGDVVPQGLDHAKLVPLLTAALQEAIAKIETLETKVAALEG